MHEELRRYRPTSHFRGRDSAVHAHLAHAAQSCVCVLVLWTHSWRAAAAAESRVTGTAAAGGRRLLQARVARLQDRWSARRTAACAIRCAGACRCFCWQVAGTYLVCGAGDSYVPHPR
jgi:hypothetical protein